MAATSVAASVTKALDGFWSLQLCVSDIALPGHSEHDKCKFND